MRRSLLTQSILDTVDRWDGSLLSPSPQNRRLESIDVFRAGWFERHFAKAHPIMPGIWWGPVIVGSIVVAARDPRFSALTAIGCVTAGLLAWTLLEYVLHRFWFHHRPRPDFDSKLKAFMLHGYHHEFPNDRLRLVAPLLLSAPLGVAIAALYVLSVGRFYGALGFAGTVLGYLAYDWVHYYTHHFRPTTRLGKYLRRYHMEHHYKDSESHFGISSPLWDWILGTAKAREARPGSADANKIAAAMLGAEVGAEEGSGVSRLPTDPDKAELVETADARPHAKPHAKPHARTDKRAS